MINPVLQMLIKIPVPHSKEKKPVRGHITVTGGEPFLRHDP